MQATQILPTGYTPHGDLSLKENRRLLILLNVLSIPWFILCITFFFAMAGLLGSASGATGTEEIRLSQVELLLALVVIVAVFTGVLVLHEAVHGLFFWLFTRSRPRFAFKGIYAYAAAPGWYIPCPQFLIIGLAPILLLSALGLLILPFMASPFSLLLLLALIINATGAIGDLYMVARLLFLPSGVLIEDQGDSIRWYVPAPQS